MENYKLMIVEDDVFYGNILKSVFEVTKMEILNVKSGEECLLNIEKFHPDILILDHDLGCGLNGIETLKKIKSKNNRINVIILTNNENFLVLKEYTNLGIFKFINKSNRPIIELLDSVYDIIEDKN